jgi:hypothetical protein
MPDDDKLVKLIVSQVKGWMVMLVVNKAMRWILMLCQVGCCVGLCSNGFCRSVLLSTIYNAEQTFFLFICFAVFVIVL